MGKILLLDEITANQIAAGEVVERPAAAVKELVENALDAGAGRIDIYIEGGGLSLIRVVDDGSGIAPEDVPVSLQRHATSKIRNSDDLTRVLSLGFRGEALPSIASVSRFRMATRRPEDMAGTEIIVYGGKTVSVAETGCPSGTDVRVEELFFNTPARQKFMKSEGSEAARVTDTVERLALAWPGVSFSLTVNGKPQFITPGNGSLEDAAGQILGRQVMRQMLPLRWEGPLLTLRGYISRPSLCRANRNQQYFFVNRRPVRSPLLSDALQTAYHTYLPRNRFPVAVIALETDTSGVDVNVHPAKREVRFSQERDVYRQVLAGVKSALGSVPLTGEIRTFPVPAFRETAANLSLYDIPAGFGCAEPVSAPPTAVFETQTVMPAVHDLPKEKEVDRPFPSMRLIGQYLATYILAQADNGDLYIVDQHAAHERVLYDIFRSDIASENLPVQETLPQVFELDSKTAAILSGALKNFEKLGLKFEIFGNNTFILRTVPLFFRHCLSYDDLLEIIAAAEHTPEAVTMYDKVLQMMACKAAVKAGQSLDRTEMEKLLDNLAQTARPFTCPHGRPTALVFTEQSVAKNFRRQ